MIKEIKPIPLAALLSRFSRSLKMIKGGITRRGDSLPRIRDGPTNEVGSIMVNSFSTVAKAIQYIKDYCTIHCDSITMLQEATPTQYYLTDLAM